MIDLHREEHDPVSRVRGLYKSIVRVEPGTINEIMTMDHVLLVFHLFSGMLEIHSQQDIMTSALRTGTQPSRRDISTEPWHLY